MVDTHFHKKNGRQWYIHARQPGGVSQEEAQARSSFFQGSNQEQDWMEEENKKIRSKARKEFNEAIRRLAAFVKKRDKRVLERQLEVQKLEKKKEEMLKLKRKKEEEEKLCYVLFLLPI